MNIWNWLLSGLAWIVSVLIVPLFGGQADYEAGMGLAALMGNNAYIVLEVVYAMFSTFNLGIAFGCFAITMLIWALDAIISLYRFIMGLIKLIPML